MSMLLRLSAAAVVSGLAAACAGPVVGPVYYGSYDPSMLNYAAGQGAVLTEIVGNPFDAPKEQLDRVVNETMTVSHFGPRVPFTGRPPEGYTSPFHTVVLFDPAPGVNPGRLCGDANQPRAARAGEVRIMIAFCAGAEEITSTQGRISGVAGPTDPNFRRLVSQMTAVLFPPFDPNRDPNEPDFDT
jgi:hypothetical protein